VFTRCTVAVFLIVLPSCCSGRTTREAAMPKETPTASAGSTASLAVPSSEATAPTAQPASQAGFTHEIANETVYYLSGPQQGRPPEGKLAAGTRVALLGDSGSYAKVRSEGGIEAWVSSGALRALSGEGAK
jgi:hypothetical protein